MPLSRILSVDDHELFRRFTYSLLEKRPEFQIIGEASDGLEAIQKAEELQPDLILLDIGLPKLNGMEAARRISIVAPHTKILFVSQESDSDVVGEALQLGAMGYVHKMRARTDLLPAIGAALEGRRFVSSGLQIGPSVEAQAQPRHEILFCSCSDPAVLMDALVSFVADALKLGNAALVRATKSRQNSLHEGLRARGIHIDAAIQRGTYAFFDVDEPARIPDAVRLLSEAAAKAGKRRPRVAVWSERTGKLWAEGKTDDAIQLEQRANELAAHHDIDILCPYPSSHDNEGHPAFERVSAEHSAVFR
jgi:CheY-like chemotaxis protein